MLNAISRLNYKIHIMKNLGGGEMTRHLIIIPLYFAKFYINYVVKKDKTKKKKDP